VVEKEATFFNFIFDRRFFGVLRWREGFLGRMLSMAAGWAVKTISASKESGDDTMPQSPHDRAAEFHNKAAHTHEAAATAHGKGDHLTAHELSKQAHEYSTQAHEHSARVFEDARRPAGEPR
jgi:hypothetical protein